MYGLVESLAGRQVITRAAFSPSQLRKPEKIEAIPLAEARLAPPVAPSKIVCVGRNYRAHVSELGHDVPAEPLLFLKPPSSIIGPNETIHYPSPELTTRVDFEGEVAVVIAKTCHALSRETDVRPFILGYTAANDITARDLQNKDGQWTRAKGFDTFCPVGPVISDEVDPWSGMEIETRVNGTVKQSGNTREFIFSLDVIIRYISQVMTLFPGDLILTGTPAGVATIQVGDLVEVEVKGIGVLSNNVSDGRGAK